MIRDYSLSRQTIMAPHFRKSAAHSICHSGSFSAIIVSMYDSFAQIYDSFMDNVDYASWASFIREVLSSHGIDDGLILDLACGTGSMTEIMASFGYDCIGVDSSAEMLQEALEKRDASGHDILYLRQDMTEFELYGTVKAVICVCDSINYITSEEDLLTVFQLVNNYLDPGGLFIFDFNTENVYAGIGSDTIAETRDDGSFIWENDYDSEEKLNESRLTLFTPAGNGLFEKSEECHLQRAWSLNEIQRTLEKAGLIFENAFENYSERPASDASERITAVAKECGKQAEAFEP